VETAATMTDTRGMPETFIARVGQYFLRSARVFSCAVSGLPRPLRPGFPSAGLADKKAAS